MELSLCISYFNFLYAVSIAFVVISIAFCIISPASVDRFSRALSLSKSLRALILLCSCVSVFLFFDPSVKLSVYLKFFCLFFLIL